MCFLLTTGEFMDLSSFLKYVIVIAIEVATSIASPSEPSFAEAAVNLNRYEGKAG
jgi:hypothetical protein